MLNLYQRAQLTFEYRQDIGHDGSNSKVYVAQDPQLDAELVIKAIPKARIGTVSEYFQEARTLYLGRHPNVVPIHYACEDEDSVYLAMPYYKTGSLNERLKHERLTVREVVRYTAQFCTGLHNIHSKGLIHFDVKPDNILLSDRDEAVVSDFGLAKQVDYSGLAGQDRMYFKMRPPEAWGRDYFSRSFDIYQVGLTLYRMTYGNAEFYRQFDVYGDQAAFDRDRFRHDVINGQFPDREVEHEHVPSRIRDVINRCLSTDPQARYQSVITLVNDMADLDGKELDWRPIRTTDGTRRWEKKLEDHECEFVVAANGESFAQQRPTGGQFRRIARYCSANPTMQERRRFFREH